MACRKANELIDYMQSNNLLPDQQSAYRPGFSTKTATVRVPSDILQAVDEGYAAVLALFDLSTSLRDLGVYINSDLSMRSRVQRTVVHAHGCFAALRRIQSVRRSLPATALEILVMSLVLTRY